MNNACPSCGAVYSVQPQHVGRRLSCKKCGVALAVDADGIHLAEMPAAPPADFAEQPSTPSLEVDERDVSPARLAGSRPSSSPPVWPRVAGVLGRVGAAFDFATILFGVGLFVLLLFFFWPLIDHARLAGHQAALRAGEQRAERLERGWNEQKDPDEAQRQRAREACTKERVRLSELVEEAMVSGARSWPTYHYGQMVGCLLLVLASLAYIRPTQPAVRRVVGATVLLAHVLLVLLVIFAVAASRHSHIGE